MVKNNYFNQLTEQALQMLRDMYIDVHYETCNDNDKYRIYTDNVVMIYREIKFVFDEYKVSVPDEIAPAVITSIIYTTLLRLKDKKEKYMPLPLLEAYDDVAQRFLTKTLEL